MIGIGEQLPDLELDAYRDGDTTRVRLSEFRGRWLVIITYPRDFTFVCPTELRDAAKLYAQFREAGAEVVSVSSDSVWTHVAWHEQSPAVATVKFPMLADPAGKLLRALGTYQEDAGESHRGTFIVDPDGVVQAMEINHDSIGRRASETLRKLQAAVHVRENKGAVVCPANWEPGQAALVRGIELVGKI